MNAHGERLRILHVCPRPNFSGLEAYAFEMAKAQMALGHQITFVVLANSPLLAKCRDAGFATLILDDNRASLRRSVANALASIDIVHLHSTQDLKLLLPQLAKNLFQKRRAHVVLQTHIWISHTKRDPLHALAYLAVDEIWCSSEPARKTLKKFLPVPKRKIRVIKYGRDVAGIPKTFLKREDARRELGLPRDAVVVGTVARIDEGKGTRELLEASLIVMAMEPRLHLVWIGPPTKDDPKAVAFADDIQKRIATLAPEFKTRVHFPGAIPESHRLLKAFDLFALPTYSECFSLSLLEAQLAGLPTLASDSGGSPEVVRPNQTGWLFTPRSTASLTQTLEQALREKNRWPQFGTVASERVRSEFDSALLLPATIAAYREILKNSAS